MAKSIRSGSKVNGNGRPHQFPGGDENTLTIGRKKGSTPESTSKIAKYYSLMRPEFQNKSKNCRTPFQGKNSDIHI